MTHRIGKIAGIAVAAFIGSVLLYLAVADVLSKITVNGDVRTTHDMQIYILSNGIHTDIVVPVTSGVIDWSRYVKYEDTNGNDTSAGYLAIGWGDKDFYLKTPRWSDVTFTVAFRAAFALGTPAIHTSFYRQMDEGERCKAISMSWDDYRKLTEYILGSFKKDSSENVINIKTDAHYGDNDAFYEAVGSFSLFHTCNTWTNNGLKTSGQKAAFWTPFDTGIFYHYSE